MRWSPLEDCYHMGPDPKGPKWKSSLNEHTIMLSDKTEKALKLYARKKSLSLERALKRVVNEALKEFIE